MSKKVAILASGGGTNAQALIDACRSENSPARIELVISDVEGAGVLARAQNAGIRNILVPSKGRPREAFETAVAAQLAGIDIICLAGFMRILSPAFVAPWLGRMLNIHPSLLHKFPASGGKGLHGEKVHAKMLEIGGNLSGCTVHFVLPEVDRGPALVCGEVPMHADDTVESLQKRVLPMEHRIYPIALSYLAHGAIWYGPANIAYYGDEALPPGGLRI